MDVLDVFHDYNGHSIEWGNATWDPADSSIRNRYDDVVTGRFNKAGSSEVPWDDFKLMLKQSIIKKKFNNAELADVLRDIANVI